MSNEPGPETLAARTELADLISEAAGGLSDRDRSVLELTYRHGLDGPDLAEALGVSPGQRHQDGAAVARHRRTFPRRTAGRAPHPQHRRRDAAELAAILDGWDGQFTVLMRKRIARHIESCPTCQTTGSGW